MVELPSLEQLLRVEPDTWVALNEWLTEVGATPAQVAPLVEVAQGVPELLRAPLLHHRLRRLSGALPVVLRLLFFGDRIDVDLLVSALGQARVHGLKEMGLVVEVGTVAYSPFEIGLFGSRFILADPHLLPGDLVMGAWRATGSLLKLARPAGRVDRALDLGCGAGALALGLADVAARVVMTDIYPRAVDFARINGLLNSRTNVEARAGDLYEPVQGETFELIVCQPPFVSAPPEDLVTYLHGGNRGDELVRRMLQGLAPFLAPGGRAYFYIQMPNQSGPALLETMRDLIGPQMTLLLLEDSQLDLDEYCAVHESRSLLEGYAVYAERVQRRREHLERMNIDSISSAYLVVINQQPALARAYKAADLVWGNGSNDDVDALLAGLVLANAKDEELSSCRLAFRGLPRCFESDGEIRIESPPLAPIQWDKELFSILVAATRAPTIGALHRQLAQGDEHARRLASGLMEAVREAGRAGLVVPAPDS